MSKDLCCLDAVGGKGCPQWVRWNDAFSNTNSNSSGGGDSYTTIGYIFDYFMYVLISVSFAFLASWLVVVYSAKGRVVGSGIPEVKTILGGFIIRKFLGVRTLFIKSMTLVLAVASGLNLGKEGPLVHISCSWSHILSRRFDKYKLNEVKRRELLSAAAAAGVSVAFGAPLGGVLFSLESVSSYFPPKTMWRSFWCAIAATLVIRYIDPFNTGQLVQFSVTNNTGMRRHYVLACAGASS